MAARRLIAVMLVLLFLSSLAAALAPVEPDDEQTSSETTTEAVPDGARDGEGELVNAELDAAAERPRSIKVRVGDQLQLSVTGSKVATVELVDIGPTEDVGPGTPARFDVLLTVRGEFPVRLLESGRRIGTIVVDPAEPEPKAPREPAPDPGLDQT